MKFVDRFAENSRFSTLRLWVAFVFFAGASCLGMLALAGTSPETARNLKPVPWSAVPKRHLPPLANGSLPSNSGPGWSVVAGPNVNDAPENNSLYGLACLSLSDCWAVGVYQTNSGSQGLIEHWNGASWVAAMAPSNTGYSVLNAVECNSASDCWAVGHDQNGALVEHWNGTAWSKVDSHDDTHIASLNATACNSSTDCWAAGAYSTGTTLQTFVEHWDGAAWIRFSSPNVDTTSDNVLTGIACTAGNDCWAVGYRDTGNASQTLIEQWNGSSWSIVSSPTTGGNQYNDLYAVTCNSSSDCWAVGGAGSPSSQDLILHWDGVLWTVFSSPGTADSNELFGVRCASTTDCWAAGVDYSTGSTHIVHWNGAVWSVVASPIRGQYNNVLRAVDCPSSSDCWTAGFSGSTSRTLAEHWDGNSWVIKDSPNIDTGYQGNSLSAVTCLTASDCWAVGSYNQGNSNGAPPVTLTGHWDGAKWTAIPSANDPATGMGFLEGVNCVGASDCWAVGYVGNYISTKVIVEHWTGGPQWMLVSAPNANATQNRLYSVACISSSDCWAVGDSNPDNNGTDWETFIEHWNGTSWTITTSGNTGHGDHLAAVACVATDNCWAVGSTTSLSANNDRSLIEHWNGTTWSIVSSPNTSDTESNYLESIACVSAVDCWAVGWSEGSGANDRTLIDYWDGSTWSIIASPNPNTSVDRLYSVACSSSSNCWSVGEHYDSSKGGYDTLIEYWNGSTWQVVDSPSPVSYDNLLYGVACGSAYSCWAAGSQFPAANGAGWQTLIEEYSPTIPAATGVVSRMVHGGTTSFGIDLPLTGARGVECRKSGGNYSIVFSFVNDVTNCGTAGTAGGSVVNGPNSNQCTENLTGVGNAQYIDVGLNNVVDAQNNTGTVSVPMGILLGDVDGSGRVDSTDVFQVREQSLQKANSTNFRLDVDLSGRVDSNDIFVTRQQSLTSLPSPP